MAIFDRNSRDEGLALKQQVDTLPPEEKQALKTKVQQELQRRKGGGLQAIQGFLGEQQNIYSQLAGVKPEAGPSQLDELIKLQKGEFEQKLNAEKLLKAQQDREIARLKAEREVSEEEAEATFKKSVSGEKPKPRTLPQALPEEPAQPLVAEAGLGGEIPTTQIEGLPPQAGITDTGVQPPQATGEPFPVTKFTEKIGGVNVTRENQILQLEQKAKEEIIKAQGGAVTKKLEKAAQSQIALSSVSPKMRLYMSYGAAGYKQAMEEASNRGIELDFEEGGFEYWKSRAAIAGLNISRLTPLLEATYRLRPEIGFELMRMIGPFRSAHAGLVFAATLPPFNGHIPSDIALSVSTLTKSFAGLVGNEELAKEVFGKELSDDEQWEKIEQFESNLTRHYNKFFRVSEVSTKFHGGRLTTEEVAAKSKFSGREEKMIAEAVAENPDNRREDTIIDLIDKGYL